VPHHGGLLLELADHVGRVVGNLLQRLVGEDVRVRLRLFNRFRIVWPVRRQRRVTGLLDEVRPVRPAARQHAETVDEDDRVVPDVFRLDLPALPHRNGRHAELLSVPVEGHPTLANRRQAHRPMIVGIVLFALAMKNVIAHVRRRARLGRCLRVCGGSAIYLLTYSAIRIRVERRMHLSRGLLTAVLLFRLRFPDRHDDRGACGSGTRPVCLARAARVLAHLVARGAREVAVGCYLNVTRCQDGCNVFGVCFVDEKPRATQTWFATDAPV